MFQIKSIAFYEHPQKKLYVLLSIFTLISFNTFAKNLDSINREVEMLIKEIRNPCDSLLNINSDLSIAFIQNKERITKKNSIEYNALQLNKSYYYYRTNKLDSCISVVYSLLNNPDISKYPYIEASTYNLLSSMYNDIGNGEKDSLYLSKAYRIAINNNLIYLIPKIGLNYYSLLNCDGCASERNTEAIKILQHSIKVAEEYNLKEYYSLLPSLCEYYYRKGKIDDAIKLIMLSLNHTNDFEDRSYSYITLGEIYFDLGKYPLAVKYLDSSLYYTQIINYNNRMYTAYELLSQIYEKSNKNKSIEYLKKVIELKKQENTIDYAQLLVNAELGHILSSKEKELSIELIKKKMLERENKNTKKMNRYLIVALLIGGVLSILLGGLLYLNIKKTNQVKELHNELKIKNSEIVSNNDVLTKLNEKLTNINEQLNVFVSAISHDLKEPLRMMRIFSELLLNKLNQSADEADLKMIGFIHDGANRMQHMIDGLLTYAKASDDIRNQVAQDSIDTNEVLKIAIQNLNLLISEKNATILYDNLPYISANKSALVMVFQNLISNSIKYCPDERHPLIQIRKGTSNNSTLSILFSDNGIGLNPKNIEKIFTPFYQEKRKIVGNSHGIGLSLCKKCIEQMGGTIVVESQENIGTTFIITFHHTEPKPFQPTLF